ncbi:PREDICTED: uncharacterized protein LOC109337244 [Lupinus angustifolius]|uniref:uncharacterized protein LOC109337244 n=1 Tax=Lupinus angustifolius TaxID=3871 RepID=UPI00092EABF4|nr:PREDICTED: uncharacterized protein LOC109337244 [Lupinus angustifolius]
MAKWKGYSLSIMGRVDLVKSVTQRMLIYSFHIYSWLSQMIKQLDTSIRNFIWSGDTTQRKLTTVAWKQVCLAIKVGGLGIKSIKILNKAAMLKLTWEMLSSSHTWAKFYRQRFGKGENKPSPCSLLDTSSPPSGQALKQTSTLLTGIHYVWLGMVSTQTFGVTTGLEFFVLHPHLCTFVADFRLDSNWAIPITLSSRFPQISALVSKITISNDGDKMIWKGTNDGILSLKDSYICVNQNVNTLKWCKYIWSTTIHPSKSFITWRLHYGKMLTDDKFQK